MKIGVVEGLGFHPENEKERRGAEEDVGKPGGDERGNGAGAPLGHRICEMIIGIINRKLEPTCPNVA